MATKKAVRVPRGPRGPRRRLDFSAMKKVKKVRLKARTGGAHYTEFIETVKKLSPGENLLIPVAPDDKAARVRVNVANIIKKHLPEDYEHAISVRVTEDEQVVVICEEYETEEETEEETEVEDEDEIEEDENEEDE